MSTTTQKGHPKGLYLLFFTEMWERFSYYGMRGILILYLTKSIIEGGLAIGESTASMIYGIFTGFVYTAPLLGGWLADKYLGKRHSITIGGLTMMAGQFVLFGMNNIFGLSLGLILLIIGNGFFKPNISTIVGQLYEPDDPRKDSAFSIFYMGINLGALFAPLVIGFIAEDAFAIRNASGEILSYGYKYGFLASGIGMLLGQIIYNSLAQKYLGDLGKKDTPSVASNPLDEVNVDESVKNKPLTKVEKDRIAVILVLTSFVVFFWAGFEQAGSSLSLYTDKYINRHIDFLDWTIPTSWFQSVNPLFIVTLAPLFAIFWNSKLGRKLSTPIKMGSGMILLGVGFLFMIGAIFQRGGDVEDSAIKASILWLIFTYFFHTIGELCLSPVGLSVVTKLSPLKYASIFMGVWLFSSGLANFLGGAIAAYVKALGAFMIFSSIAIFVIVLGLIMIGLNKWIVAKMHGVK